MRDKDTLEDGRLQREARTWGDAVIRLVEVGDLLEKFGSISNRNAHHLPEA